MGSMALIFCHVVVLMIAMENSKSSQWQEKIVWNSNVEL